MTETTEYDGRLIVGGVRRSASSQRPSIDPYRGAAIAQIDQATPSDVEAAIEAAAAGGEELASMPTHARTAILRRAAAIVEDRVESYARTISRQTGKALRDTRREVSRSTYTFQALATAAELLGTNSSPADALPTGDGAVAVSWREPVGVVGAITPFNAPFNIPTHKIAGALVAGNGVVVKPAPQAPLSAFQLVEVLLEAGCPPNAVSVLPGSAEVGEAIVASDRVDAITFTGGVGAGLAISQAAGLKRLVLELGGNSANVVHRDVDPASVVPKLVAGGFSNTGQSCNSVQRVIAHESIVDEVTDRLTRAAASLVVGDPLDPATEVGTLVDEAAAIRLETWLAEAADRGADVRGGGPRVGASLPPAVVANVDRDDRVSQEELFGPAVVVLSYADVDEAIEIANSTRFGLQGAVFTHDIDVAYRIARALKVGGVMVNRSSNTRLDQIGFGGVRDSGVGREGGRSTIEALTVAKTMIVQLESS